MTAAIETKQQVEQTMQAERTKRLERYRELLELDKMTSKQLREAVELCQFLTGDSRLMEPHRAALRLHRQFTAVIDDNLAFEQENADAGAKLDRLHAELVETIQKAREEYRRKAEPLRQLEARVAGARSTHRSHGVLRHNIERGFSVLFEPHPSSTVKSMISTEPNVYHPDLLQSLVAAGVIQQVKEQNGMTRFFST